MKNRAQIDINAPSSEIFKWLRDTELIKKWVPNYVDGKMVDEKPGMVGSTFVDTFE